MNFSFKKLAGTAIFALALIFAFSIPLSKTFADPSAPPTYIYVKSVSGNYIQLQHPTQIGDSTYSYSSCTNGLCGSNAVTASYNLNTQQLSSARNTASDGAYFTSNNDYHTSNNGSRNVVPGTATLAPDDASRTGGSTVSSGLATNNPNGHTNPNGTPTNPPQNPGDSTPPGTPTPDPSGIDTALEPLTKTEPYTVYTTDANGNKVTLNGTINSSNGAIIVYDPKFVDSKGNPLPIELFRQPNGSIVPVSLNYGSKNSQFNQSNLPENTQYAGGYTAPTGATNFTVIDANQKIISYTVNSTQYVQIGNDPKTAIPNASYDARTGLIVQNDGGNKLYFNGDGTVAIDPIPNPIDGGIIDLQKYPGATLDTNTNIVTYNGGTTVDGKGYVSLPPYTPGDLQATLPQGSSFNPTTNTYNIPGIGNFPATSVQSNFSGTTHDPTNTVFTLPNGHEVTVYYDGSRDSGTFFYNNGVGVTPSGQITTPEGYSFQGTYTPDANSDQFGQATVPGIGSFNIGQGYGNFDESNGSVQYTTTSGYSVTEYNDASHSPGALYLDNSQGTEVRYENGQWVNGNDQFVDPTNSSTWSNGTDGTGPTSNPGGGGGDGSGGGTCSTCGGSGGGGGDILGNIQGAFGSAISGLVGGFLNAGLQKLFGKSPIGQLLGSVIGPQITQLVQGQVSSLLGGGAGGLVGGAGGSSKVPVIDSDNLKVNSTTAQQTTDLRTKDYVLNQIAKQVAQKLTQQVTSSLINWVNTGFNGNPAFLQNPQQFFQGISEGVSANFIQGGALNGLSSSFQNQIKQQLSYDQNQTVGSSLQSTINPSVASGVMNGTGQSVNNFYAFIQPNNNPSSAYINSQDAMANQINTAITAKQNELNQGQGFQSQTTCTTPGINGYCLQSKVITPGITIKDELSNALSRTQYDPYINPNEINGVASALGNQLFDKLFSSSGSLFGLSDTTNGNSFANRLGGDGNSAGTVSSKAGALKLMQDTLTSLKSGKYAAAKTLTLAELAVGATTTEGIVGCYAAKETDPKRPLSAEELVTANERIAVASSTVQDLINRGVGIGNDLNILAIAINRVQQFIAQVKGLSATPAKTIPYMSVAISETSVPSGSGDTLQSNLSLHNITGTFTVSSYVCAAADNSCTILSTDTNPTSKTSLSYPYITVSSLAPGYYYMKFVLKNSALNVIGRSQGFTVADAPTLAAAPSFTVTLNKTGIYQDSVKETLALRNIPDAVSAANYLCDTTGATACQLLGTDTNPSSQATSTLTYNSDGSYFTPGNYFFQFVITNAAGTAFVADSQNIQEFDAATASASQAALSPTTLFSIVTAFQAFVNSQTFDASAATDEWQATRSEMKQLASDTKDALKQCRLFPPAATSTTP